jgi:hypothetical protein
MSLPKLFLTVSVALFVIIGSLALMKRSGSEKTSSPASSPVKQEVDLSLLIRTHEVRQAQTAPQQTELLSPALSSVQPAEERPLVIEHDAEPEGLSVLFSKGSCCQIVETISYKSHVPWKRHRPAWLIDYANYYTTPLDFIYRSFNGNRDATPTAIADGMQFNVFRRDLDFRFHIVVSLSSCRIRLYYVIPQERRVVFLKSYQVCVGRKDASHASGCLTPIGMYQLGPRVAVFRPKMMGMYKGKQIELMKVFGLHWIPFEKEIEGCSEPAKGFGIHGTPICRGEQGDELEEDNSSIGRCESDGCIRLAGKDMKELFSVVSTRTTYVEIVQAFQQSKLLRGEI